MKNTKWLGLILIYNIDLENTIASESLSIDKNLWIGSLKYEKFNSKNIQVVVVVIQKNKDDNSKIETVIYEKINNSKGFKKIEHNLQNDLVLVEYDATVDLFSFLNNKYKPEKKLVITLGHGSVFGINYCDLSIPKLINKSLDNGETSITDLNKYFGNYGEEKLSELYIKKISKLDFTLDFEKTTLTQIYRDGNKRTYQLTNKELAESFKVFDTIANQKNIDILVINNCFMQNIFAQFDYSSSVDYYVAPISGISYPGYNFLEILHNINDDPNNSTEAIANSFVNKQIIENHALYKRPRNGDYSKESIDNRWFLQCIQLEEETFKNIKTSFSKYINELYELAKATRLMRTFIKDTYYNCYKYSEKSLENLNLIDFQTFVNTLHDYLIRNNDNRLASLDDFFKFSKELLLIFNSIKISNYCGKNFLLNWENFNDKTLGPSTEEAIKKIGLGFYLSKNLPKNSPLNVIFDDSNPYKPSISDNTKYFDLLKLMSENL